MTDWTHPCHMIWDLAGQPAPTETPTGHGTCAHCGQVGMLSAKLGPNFTDYRQLAHITGTALCPACSWVTGGKPPNTLRMWSIVARVDQPCPHPTFEKPPYASGEYLQLTNRKDMRWLAATLATPPPGPWLVAVAETGQKHTAPFTAINHGHGPWSIRVDGAGVDADPDTWRLVLSRSAALRAAGFSATAIETGNPPFIALKGDGLAQWRSHAPHIAPHRDTLLLHLANLTITKETLDDHCATYPTD